MLIISLYTLNSNMFRSNTLQRVATVATKRAFNTAAPQVTGSNKLLLAGSAVTAVTLLAVSSQQQSNSAVSMDAKGEEDLMARVVGIEEMIKGMKSQADEDRLVQLVHAAVKESPEMIMGKVSF